MEAWLLVVATVFLGGQSSLLKFRLINVHVTWVAKDRPTMLTKVIFVLLMGTFLKTLNDFRQILYLLFNSIFWFLVSILFWQSSPFNYKCLYVHVLCLDIAICQSFNVILWNRNIFCYLLGHAGVQLWTFLEVATPPQHQILVDSGNSAVKMKWLQLRELVIVGSNHASVGGGCVMFTISGFLTALVSSSGM